MDRVIHITQKIFGNIFINNRYIGQSLVNILISFIKSNPYLLIGISLVIIGFVVSIIRRIIYS